ncbi:MAG: AAA family ATPase [Planctomycetota bacterium]|nr:AAA family ATPase [Planctomycetota bacterium]
MTIHMSARVAWHMDGWNGHICQNPAANTYCVGPHSYPGEMIAERRDLPLEVADAGKCCTKIGHIPACCYSINAFGKETIKAFSEPPNFFKDDTRRAEWELPPATVSVWPYEVMYGDDVKDGDKYDYQQRLENAHQYFSQFKLNSSLIIYYANYSNPLNQDERRYAIVGLSRIKRIGDIRYFENCSERVREKYAGGFIWQCDVTSHYPDQGVRLPYHRYLDKPEILERFAFYPDNAQRFKYATRELTDDDALEVVERFLEIAGTLHELGDTSEDWPARIKWLNTLIAELWQHRGLYPGMPHVMSVLGLEQAIPFWKKQVLAGTEKETHDVIMRFVQGKLKSIPGLQLDDNQVKIVHKKWKLKEDNEQTLLRDVLPRFELAADQIEAILNADRSQNGIYSTLEAIAENPYIVAEEYTGNDPDDHISFNRIDHGVFPSPDLGGEPLADKDDGRRLRGLCIDRFHREQKHTFLAADTLIHDINHKLSFQPDWKRQQFIENYFAVEEELLTKALVFRELNGRKYVYQKRVHDDERWVERYVRQLASRADIKLRSAVTAATWRTFLTDSDSVLNKKSPQEYANAIEGQIEVCQKVFLRPVSVICGAAGTGKTRVIDAIIKAIEKGHGTGTSFQLLAPTGKAADRIRELTKKPATTVHSFLASQGWLNTNRTLRLEGGKQEDKFQTYIIDEASMLNLEVAAALFRAIDWTSVQRLIFVGDPNQLPPIGVGKVFADIINWMGSEQPDSVAELTTNIRQMENRIEGHGTGILDLASLYVRETVEDDNEERKAEAEALLQKVQEGGDVDTDLRITYWNTAEELAKQIEQQFISDIEADSKLSFNVDKPYEAWGKACEGKDGVKRPEYLQVISPYRGDLYGTDHLNTVIQRLLQPYARKAPGQSVRALDGIMLSDKVIQTRNRTKSDPVWAYSFESKQNESVQVFNGELGFVRAHPFDKDKLGWKGFRLERFNVSFARKENLLVGYGNKLGKKPNGNWLPQQKVEDNLELAYAISVHKAQGSEFERVYFIVPKHKAALLSPELFYTGMTRGRRHCTLFIQEDVSPLLSMRRPERSHLLTINSSLFAFKPLADALLSMGSWYEEGKIHETLAAEMVRSKSEVIIANMLFERGIKFRYEVRLSAPDGTFYLPDFTVRWNGEDWYWEHWGRMDEEKYRKHREEKVAWYKKNFSERLIETFESGTLSVEADRLITQYFS